MKVLRTALFQLQESSTMSQVGKTLSGKISDCLQDARWPEAMALLRQMRTEQRIPKLG